MSSLRSGVTEVRLSDGDGRCSGIPEVLHQGTWKRLSQMSFNAKSAAVVCRDLNCGDVVTVSFHKDVGYDSSERSEMNITCAGYESVATHCSFSSLPHSDLPGVIILTCSGKSIHANVNARLSHISSFGLLRRIVVLVTGQILWLLLD